MKISITHLRNLIVFVIIYSSCSIIHGQGISTVSQIYDYDVGDQFHHYSWAQHGMNGYIQYSNHLVLEKFYSTYYDTLFYVEDISIYYSDSEGTVYFSYYIDTLSYTNLDSLINAGDIDTVYSNPDLYNGREINYREMDFVYDYYETKFINGCGGPFTYHSHWEPPFADWDEGNELIYYLKGDEEWGIPFFVTTNELRINQNLFTIFPNPASDFISIVMDLKPTQKLEGMIFSNIGNKTKSFIINDDENQINVSDLESGLYFIYIISNTVIYRGKFIKN